MKMSDTAFGYTALLTGLIGIGAVASACASVASAAPSPTYHVYVANESSDLVSHIAFNPDRGAWVERSIPVGLMPSDNDGAHGLSVAPDGEHWYVTLAHGSPNGQLWTFQTGTDSLVARTELGLFPATMGVTPDGTFLLAVNFNLHGDPVPSDVSVVHLPTQTQLARIETCVTPHGSRVDESGRFHYSACMRSDQLVQIDLTDLRVSRRFSVRPGSEGPLELFDTGAAGSESAPAMGAEVCMPTWVEPGLGARTDKVYVACNRSGDILEIDTGPWQVSRRFASGAGPYNLEVTADGKTLIATLKGEQAVQLIDLTSGQEVARVRTSRSVTHGVVASPDGRFAFVSNESVGSLRSTVDVIDLAERVRVASVEVGHQAGGIDFWTMRVGSR